MNSFAMLGDVRSAKDAAETFLSTGNAARLSRANTLAQGGFAQSNPFRHYIHLRISQKEPFDILYLTPTIAVIANVDDHSLTLGPELVYTGITKWEFRLKGAVNIGSDET